MTATAGSVLPGRVRLDLPAWVGDAIDAGRSYPGDADKVALAIDLSRRNVEAGSGGPFGAAVFGPDHRLVAVGVNRVLPQACSVAHAETMAFMLAQQRIGRSRLNRDETTGAHLGAYTLATSAQPCCQCYGASFWAGIDRLLIGARSEDVMALTEFDEGPLPADWVGELERRGIAVVRDLHREAACAVLRDYGARGGIVY
jgi:tRNA(Arg) A34 adenosine deaminase TadA